MSILYWCDFCETEHDTVECQHPRFIKSDDMTPEHKEAVEKRDEYERCIDEIEIILDSADDMSLEKLIKNIKQSIWYVQ